MQRCTHPTAVDGLFTSGNPLTGVPATTPGASWFNSAQEELAVLVEASGQELDPTRYDQVLEAITHAALGRSVFANEAINGAFDFWQRGVSFAVTSTQVFGPDRYFLRADTSGSGTATITRQAFVAGQTDVPGHPSSFMRWLQTAGATGAPRFGQRIEDVVRFFGATITVRFWTRCLTAQSCTLRVDRNFGTGGSAQDNTYASTFQVANLWQRHTFTVTVAEFAGQTIGPANYLELRVEMPAGATFQLDVADLSVQYGRFASRFPRAPEGVESIRVQRYYQKSYQLATAPATVNAVGAVRTRGIANPDCPQMNTRFPVPMRDTPTIVWYSLAGTADRCTNNGSTDVISSQQQESSVCTGFFHVATTGTDRTIAAHFTATAEL